MLGQPVYFLTPDVVGVRPHRAGCARACTATDLVLTVTEMLRKAQGGRQVRRVLRRGHRARWPCPTARPSPTWRPSTARPWASSRSTRRPSTTSAAPAAPRTQVDALRSLLPGAGPVRRAAGRRDRLLAGACELDLGDVTPSLAGPKRPQDRIELGKVASNFAELFSKPCRERLQPAAELLLTRHLVRASGETPTQGAATRHAAGAGASRWRWRQQAHAGLGAVERRPRSTAGRHHRQRRRADRRDHLLHQHLQPRRAAGRRPAREEGGRERA